MKSSVKCPTCRRDTQWTGNPYRPFCSERCRTIDLGAWASESYRIPGETIEEDTFSDSNISVTDDQLSKKA